MAGHDLCVRCECPSRLLRDRAEFDVSVCERPGNEKRPRTRDVSLCFASFLDNFCEIHEQLSVASEGFEPPKS